MTGISHHKGQGNPMVYERIDRPKGLLYHYTKRENIEPILQDGRIRKFKDRECWFCASLEDNLRLMELTVMEEGKLYYDTNGLPRRYPKFIPEEYVVLELSPRYQNGDWVISTKLPSLTQKTILNKKNMHSCCANFVRKKE